MLAPILWWLRGERRLVYRTIKPQSYVPPAGWTVTHIVVIIAPDDPFLFPIPFVPRGLYSIWGKRTGD